MVKISSFLLVLLLALKGFALDPNVTFDKYISRQWSTREGLPQDTVTCIVRDLKGFIWLGTGKGVARFDGKDFDIFNKNNTNAIKSNSITSLFVSIDGTLWIGTDGGGLTIYKNNRFRNCSTADGLPSDFITSITGDNNNQVWGSTGNGRIFRLDIHRDNVNISYRSLQGSCVHSFIFDSSGERWIGTEEGLRYFKKKKLTLYTVNQGLTDNHIRGVCEDCRGSIWVGTKKGINIIEKRDEKTVSITTLKGLTDCFIHSIFEDSGGVIWVAADSGLYRLIPGTGKGYQIEKVSSIDVLSGQIPLISLLEDKEGILWIGTAGKGFISLRDGNFTFYTTEDGLSHNYVQSICQDDDAIWIGTDGGGLNKLKQGKFTRYTVKNGLSSNYINSICRDKEGNLWVGTPEGLNRFKNNRFKVYTKKDGLTGNSISALYTDRQGNLWIGTYNGGLSGYKDGKFYTPGKREKIPPHIAVLSLAGDKAGKLWVGTGNGLYCLKNNRFIDFRKRETLSKYMIRDIYIDRGGHLWLGTDSSGVVCLTGGGLITYRWDSELITACVYRILEDNEENLWLSTNRGLLFVSKTVFGIYGNKFSQRFYYRYRKQRPPPDRYFHFLEDDGLKTVVFTGGSQPAGWKTTDGRMWFPTIDGITVVTPKKEPVKVVLPVVINKVVVDGQFFFPDEPAEFPLGASEIEFHFTALNFRGVENIKFKYQLVNPHRLTFRRRSGVVDGKRVLLRDIPPGNYRFSVTAGSDDKGWSKKWVSYDFTLPYKFSGGEWFIFVLIALLAVLLVVVLKVMERRAKEKEMLRIFREDERYKTSALKAKKVKKVLLQLLELMEKEKPYLDPDMTVTKLAKKLGIPKEHISQVVNQQFYMNFNHFLNKYRIEEAKKRLKDPAENKYVVLKIAYDVGFNSKSTFNTAFKKFTGMSPSEYREKGFEGEK